MCIKNNGGKVQEKSMQTHCFEKSVFHGYKDADQTEVPSETQEKKLAHTHTYTYLVCCV